MKLYFTLVKQLLLVRSLFLLITVMGRNLLLCELDAYNTVLYVRKSCFYSSCLFLKSHYYTRYRQLTELACVDYPQRVNRFSLTYWFLSCFYNTRVAVTCLTDSLTGVPSLVTLFAGSNWSEREVWDMFGVLFFRHPDLRRILTDYGFLGHPLRKDFPLSGFVEVYFNDMTQLVCYQSLSLAQEFRDYGRGQNPWFLG